MDELEAKKELDEARRQLAESRKQLIKSQEKLDKESGEIGFLNPSGILNSMLGMMDTFILKDDVLKTMIEQDDTSDMDEDGEIDDIGEIGEIGEIDDIGVQSLDDDTEDEEKSFEGGIDMNTEKDTVFAMIVGKVKKLRDQIEEIRENEQEVFDDLTERQQESKKGEALQELIDNLDTAYSDLDDVVDVLETYTNGITYEEDEPEEETDLGLKVSPHEPKEAVNPDFAKNLRKNIEVMTNTFDENNLQCLNIGCKYIDDMKEPYLKILVEMSTINGPVEDDYLELKINLYDEDGDLFYTNSSSVEYGMSGFDTLEISCGDKKNDLRRATKGRLYVAR